MRRAIASKRALFALGAIAAWIAASWARPRPARAASPSAAVPRAPRFDPVRAQTKAGSPHSARAQKPWLRTTASRDPAPDESAVPAEDAAAEESSLTASLRVGAGGYLAKTGSEGDRRTLSGVPAVAVAFLGARVTPELAVGGVLLLHSIYAVSVHDELDDGDEPRLSRGLRQRALGLGALVRAASGPGWHGLIALGLGTISVPKPDTSSPKGVEAHVSVGRDWGPARGWRLSVAGDLTWASMKVDEGGGTALVTSWSPTLSLGVNYE